MKKHLLIGLAALVIAGLLIAQVPGKHLSFNSDRFWANSGVLATDSRIESRGTSNGFRAQYSENNYASLSALASGALSLNRVTSGTSGGTVKIWTYQADAIADDGTVSLPDATDGLVIISDNAEGLIATVKADGTCTKVAGSTNTAVADTDADLDVFDGGTSATVKNRLGATGKIRITYLYY